MNAEIKEKFVVMPSKLSSKVLSGDYMLMRKRDFEIVFDRNNLEILLAILRGHNKFTDIMKSLNIQRGKLARHLKKLVASGWLIKDGNEYRLSASVYAVYDALESNDGINIRIINNEGAYLDPEHGLIIIGAEPSQEYCKSCPLRQVCVDNVRDLANKYGVKLRGAEPSEAYMELFNALITRDLIKGLRIGVVRIMVMRRQY